MSLRRDLDGLVVRMPGEATIFMIDKGKKRGFPDLKPYKKLYGDTGPRNVHLDLHLDLIDEGEPIPMDAELVEYKDGVMVWLKDQINGIWVLRHVANEEVMARFQFSWAKIHKDDNTGYEELNYEKILNTLTKEGRPD